MDAYLPDSDFVENMRRALLFKQVNKNLLKNGTGVNLQGNAAYPASTYFVDNFQRAISTGTITQAQLTTPSTIVNVNTYAPANAAFVLECNRAGAFGQLKSSIS